MAGARGGCLALALALKNDWQTVYQAAVDAKGATGGSATTRRQATLELKTALGLLRLELGKQLLRQAARLKSLFPQQLLGQPLEGGGEDEGEGGGGEPPEPPEAPTGVTATQEGEGAAVVINAEEDEEATEWQAFELPAGSSDEPTLVGSSATLPLSMTRSPGEFLYTLKKKVDGVLSAPSAPVALTVT